MKQSKLTFAKTLLCFFRYRIPIGKSLASVLFIFLMTGSLIANAQTNVTVTGTVTNNTGDPLEGVTISLKNTQTSTSTDAQGKFSINVPDAKGILVMSYVGFATQEISVANRAVINVSMESEATSLNEVVVVGYGTVQKRELTSAVTTISFGERKICCCFVGQDVLLIWWTSNSIAVFAISETGC